MPAKKKNAPSNPNQITVKQVYDLLEYLGGLDDVTAPCCDCGDTTDVRFGGHPIMKFICMECYGKLYPAYQQMMSGGTSRGMTKREENDHAKMLAFLKAEQKRRR